MSVAPSNTPGMYSSRSTGRTMDPASGQYMDYQADDVPKVSMSPIQPPAGPALQPTAQPAYQPAALDNDPVMDEDAGRESDDDSQYDEVWINKAKEIVDQTRNDPYRQSKAISKLKADYLKARYNKDVKVVEDS